MAMFAVNTSAGWNSGHINLIVAYPTFIFVKMERSYAVQLAVLAAFVAQGEKP